MSGRSSGPRENLGARRVGRLGFLGVVGGGAATLFYGNTVARLVGKAANPVASISGLSDLLPSGGWRIYTVAATMPRFDPATWRLEVRGLAQRPYTLDYEALLRLPRVEQVSNFHCVTGWEVKGVAWAGVRLTDLLDRAAPMHHARAVRFVSAEHPYDDYLTLAQARLPQVLLAYEMNGRPLAREHGAPVRLVIPEMYGYKNVKWVARIDLVPAVKDGYWEYEGYDRDAWVGRSNGYGGVV